MKEMSGRDLDDLPIEDIPQQDNTLVTGLGMAVDYRADPALRRSRYGVMVGLLVWVVLMYHAVRTDFEGVRLTRRGGASRSFDRSV